MTKTITIMNDAYELIKNAKTEDESFSQLFRRTYGAKKRIKDLFGALEADEEKAKTWKKTVRSERAKDTKSVEARYARLRHLGNN